MIISKNILDWKHSPKYKVRLNSEKFQNFKFAYLNSLFLRKNHKKDGFPDFHEFTLYMIFAIVLKMTISVLDFLVKKSYKGWIRKKSRNSL